MKDIYSIEAFRVTARRLIPHGEKLAVIAYRSGLSESTISRALSGARPVSLSTATRILRTYGATPVEIAGIILPCP